MTQTLKPCPFCGASSAILEDKKAGEIGWSETHWFHIKCGICGATSSPVVYLVLAKFTSFTVQDFRDNPILRVVEEEKHAAYITAQKQQAADCWNRRIEI